MHNPGQHQHLREAHAHLASFGESLLIPSLERCAGVAECLEVVAHLAADARDGARPFVRLTAARVESWREGRWPTLAELGRAAPDVPVVIMSFDHHAAAANAAALAAAALRPRDVVPPNGVVCADEAGNATGLLLEQAAYRVWDAAPAPSADQLRGHVAGALRALAALGYTDVHDLHSQPWLGPVLAEMERAGELPLSVRLYPPARDLAAAAAGRRAWESDRLRLAGGKLFADGTLNSRTALMLVDYADPAPGMPRGKAMLSDAELDESIALCKGLGLGLAVHAIGDGAVRMVLDAYQRGRVPRDGSFRIEHCELIDRADVPRFAEMGVVCSVQPCHLLADIEALERYLPHRLHRVLPLRELIDSGCRPGAPDGLWFGSDVPIVRANPEDSIAAATLRRRPDMPESRAIGWDQRISEAEAWAAFGATGAESSRRGSSA